MEPESAARWECLQNQTINGLVGGRVFRHRLEEQIDGTGLQAIVVYRQGGWATPDRVKSLDYPILVLDCYADPSRDVTGLTMQGDSEDKAWALARAVDRRFHAVADQWWGARGTNPGLRVVTSRRWASPELVTRQGGRNIGVSQHDDTNTLGDVAIVRARYALEI